MKLIHLISGGDVGGAKTHVLSLLQGLNPTYRSTLKQRAIRLVVKSKINVPSDCEELNYLLS